MKIAKEISGVRKDYIASYLRFQIGLLQGALENIEKEDNCYEQQLEELLKKARRGFYQFKISYN